MRMMTDHRIDERAKTTQEADANSMHEGAAERQTRADSAGGQKDTASQQSAQNGAQPAKRRRNRSIGRKAVLLYKINERLLGMDVSYLQLMLLYACAQRVNQAIRRLKRHAPKKVANSGK